MAEILHIAANPSLSGLANMNRDVAFSALGLKCDILTPWNMEADKQYPAIVFVQGSAWTFPNVNYEVLQLGRYAQLGYVVMTVTHRSREDGHAYPAFLQDVKCAIRYLRANAEKYHVNKERIAIWGTSSGGNTSMLVQLTGDDPAFRTDEYASESDAVCCAVECFGPSDMLALFKEHLREAEMVQQLCGDQDPVTVAKGMSPYHIVQDGKAYPPILMLHGSGDELVNYETQGVVMYERYLQAGVDASMICIDGAPHEGSFWSDAVHREILAFLDRHLKG